MTAVSHPSNRPRPIESRNDLTVKRIRNLHLRAERARTGLYYIEGVRFVAQAIGRHVRVETLVVCPSLLVHPFARKMVRRQQRAGTPVLEVTPDVLHSLALVDDPQGIGAVVHQRWEPLERVTPGDELCWIAHDLVQSAGNLGTIMRTSEAVGGAGIILLGNAVDPYDPAAVRASMGALFAQRVVRASVAAFARWKEQHGFLLVGTSPAAETDYHDARYAAPTVLLMGGERKGLSPELQALCDVMVRIPMVGRGDSLNVSVATAVILYEVFNQRRARSVDYTTRLI